MLCPNCNKQIEGSAQKKFCNDKCRKAYGRKLGQTAIEKSDKTEVGQAEKEKSDTLRKLTACEIYDAINSYQGNGWTTSPEYLELIRRLKIMPVKKLREKGFSIPLWKENGLKCPF